MDNKKKWDVLILDGNSEHIDIISSYICDYSTGGYCKENKYLYYFNSDNKIIINDILNEHIKNFDINFTWDIQDEENWHLSWKDNFIPIQLDSDLIIVPDWDSNKYDYNNIIKIKPGMAFGTGHHETTFLMLKHLINNLNNHQTVLDLGTGSGILAIAAYFYKAKKITAVEFDEDCKDNFIENIRINNVPMDAIDLLMIDALKHNNFNYDIILANINKNIIKELIPKFKDSKAMVLLSGILVKDREELISLLSLNNLKLLFEDKYNEWLFMAVKNA